MTRHRYAGGGTPGARRWAAGAVAAVLLAALPVGAACRADTDCDAASRCDGGLCVARRTARDAALAAGGLLTGLGVLLAVWATRRGARGAVDGAAPFTAAVPEAGVAGPWVPVTSSPASGPVVGVLRPLSGGPDVPLRRGAFVVGASREADVVLSAASVSARHARLEVTTAGALLVTDLDSTNGTFMNGTRLPPGLRVALQAGDELALSRAVRLRFLRK